MKTVIRLACLWAAILSSACIAEAQAGTVLKENTGTVFGEGRKQEKIRISASTPKIGKTFSFNDFNAISCGSVFDFVLIPSREERIEMEFYQPLEPYIRVEKKGRTLTFDIGNIFCESDSRQNTAPLVRIYFKDMRKISLSGLCSLKFEGEYDGQGTSLNIALSGSDRIEGSVRNLSNLNISASGLENIRLDLKEVETAKFNFSGSVGYEGKWTGIRQIILNNTGIVHTDIRLDGSQAVNLVCSGTGEINGNWTGIDNLSVKSSGVSKIFLEGDVRKASVSASGAGSIDMRKTACQEMEASNSGVTEMNVTALRYFSGKTSGVAKIGVYGNPSQCYTESDETSRIILH